MTRARKTQIMLFVAVILMFAVFAGVVVRIGESGRGSVSTAQDVPAENGNALASFVVTSEEGADSSQGQTLSEDGILNERGRLTQRVTIYDENGTLPISATVTKSQDAFYPGTYELTFSRNAILSKKATVQVKVDVMEGETVYILTGNKEKGYVEVAKAQADADKCVFFETQLLQNYTLSTTNICEAQEAMASYKGN